MRIGNPRLVRLGSLAKGAIIEPGDGELIVPPYIQPVIELSAPLDRVFSDAQTPGALQDDSHIKTLAIARNGVNALTVTDGPTMTKGLWSFTASHTFMFSGTTDMTKRSYVALIDPDTNVGPLWQYTHITGFQRGASINFFAAFQRDGFFFRLQQDATIAADLFWLAASIFARRVL
jgi:hypothetical protein